MTFTTYQEAADYVASREAEVGAMKFRSTDEYRNLYPQMATMYQAEGRKRAPRRKKIHGFGICRF
jgi:hypothetical protein